jgi:hypothetical protein
VSYRAMPWLLPTPVRKTNIPENEDNIDVCISDFANGPLIKIYRPLRALLIFIFVSCRESTFLYFTCLSYYLFILCLIHFVYLDSNNRRTKSPKSTYMLVFQACIRICVVSCDALIVTDSCEKNQHTRERR